ncbi:15950_t:CDS:2, partial [Dentiscutata heterogama]
IENFDKEMRESNLHILLILDGASLHVTDTSIIALFKLHYHHMQLQHEAEESNIYKVNQLQAIRWVKFYTKIVSPRDKDEALVVLPSLIENVEEGLFFDYDNELAIKKLQQILNILHVRNPMPIEDLLNLEKKNVEIYQQFNDDDFI